VRDRRWDYLYDVQKQPVREVIVEKFADQLAEELRGWPPPFGEWVTEPLRLRWAAGLEARPSEGAIRFAIELARLDLAREYEAYEHAMVNERPRRWIGAGEEAAGHLLVLYLTEQCHHLREWADGAKLTRDDLVRALGLLEQRLFKVTLA
jgi:hypothetical protein